MDLIHYLVVDTMTVKEALDKIEKNWVGCVIVQNKSEEVIGIATDGDIRRFLISGNNLDDPISECTNGDFVWVEEHTPREVILKQLDNQIPAIQSDRSQR